MSLSSQKRYILFINFSCVGRGFSLRSVFSGVGFFSIIDTSLSTVYLFNFWIMYIRIWHMQICRYVKGTAKGQSEGFISRHSRCSSFPDFLTWQRLPKFSFTHLKSFGHCISPMSCSSFFLSSSFMFFQPVEPWHTFRASFYIHHTLRLTQYPQRSCFHLTTLNK